MRLTLRTLLAYLDDRLAPNQAKEIGQKVTSSPFATELADRIKSVVRRRRLAKESAGQKTIDANLIAEYLDDQLTPELVALIEKEILSSDATLAEVAATHQIIGTLNDSVEPSDAIRERLYKLGPQPDHEDLAEVPESTSDWEPLKPQATKQKRSPMLLLGVMVLGWLGLVATDSNLWQSAKDVSVAQKELTEPAIDDPLLVAEGQAVQPPVNAPAQAATNPATNPAPVADAGVSDMNADNNAANSEPATGIGATEPPISNPADVASDPASIASMPPVNNPPVADTTAATATEPDANMDTNGPTEEVVSLQFVDDYTMAVQHNADDNSWTWVSENGVAGNWLKPLTESVFAIAQPFDVKVFSDSAGWIATIHGSTLFRSTASGDGIELIDGSLVVQTINDQTEATFMTVSCGGTDFQVSVPLQQKHRIGVTVEPVPLSFLDAVDPPESASFIPEEQPCLVTVFATDCNLVVTLNSQQIVVQRGQKLTWQTNSQLIPAAQPASSPEWMFAITNPKTDAASDLLTETAAEFRKSSSVADAASDLLDSRNPLIAKNGVQLPIVTRDVDDLCTILLETDQTMVRTGAIAGLQKIILTSALGKQKVSESLRTRLPELETENAMRLLAGITKAEAEDQYTSSWLVGMLESNRAGLRELAIGNLTRLTGSDESFQADDEATRRGSAIRRWKKVLSRNDGRLLKP